jgi:hypothetical protein
MADESIVCPTCAREHSPSERFCVACGMPLVKSEGSEGGFVSERRETARKIKPEYAEGELVQVARANDLWQAEFIAGLLLEEGIPSLIRVLIGGYAPIIGTREILVPESGAEAAREALKWERPPEDC